MRSTHRQSSARAATVMLSVLRADIADAVSGPEEAEEELRHLFRVPAG